MRTALYARVSTTDKDQNPETQFYHLRAYCEAHGHQITATFLDERSGKDPVRPALQEMLIEAKTPKTRRFDMVVCLRLDRFMRSALYGLQATEELRQAGVELVFVKDQIDTTTPGGRFFYTLMLAFAQMEREHHAERVSEGIKRRIGEGSHWGKGQRKDINIGIAQELLKSGKARNVAHCARLMNIPLSTLIDHAKRKGITLADYIPPKNGG